MRKTKAAAVITFTVNSTCSAN